MGFDLDFDLLLDGLRSNVDQLQLELDYASSEKELAVDERSEALLVDIKNKIQHIESNGFTPEFIIMNTRNYERLIAYYSNGAIDELFGYKVVIWDVPVDYVNVRCSASDEWSYGEAIRRDAKK